MNTEFLSVRFVINRMSSSIEVANIGPTPTPGDCEYLLCDAIEVVSLELGVANA